MTVDMNIMYCQQTADSTGLSNTRLWLFSQGWLFMYFRLTKRSVQWDKVIFEFLTVTLKMHESCNNVQYFVFYVFLDQWVSTPIHSFPFLIALTHSQTTFNIPPVGSISVTRWAHTQGQLCCYEEANHLSYRDALDSHFYACHKCVRFFFPYLYASGQIFVAQTLYKWSWCTGLRGPLCALLQCIIVALCNQNKCKMYLIFHYFLFKVSTK